MSNNKNDGIFIDLTTSCTVDNALRHLLGIGPSTSNDLNEIELADVDTLENLLSCILEDAYADYSNAKFDKVPADVIAATLENLNKAKLLIDNARRYRSDIIDELAKGAASNLHIDSVATPNARNPYITLISLKKWAHKVLKISILAELGIVKPIHTVSKARQQENAILDAIKKLGYNPKKLPELQPGKAGVKSAVRQLVQHPPLFISVKVFDTAWDRLLKYKDVINLE